MLNVTLLYAAIFALFAMYLSSRAGLFRGKLGVSIHYGEPPNHELQERVRVHQNFLEYVPMILILMAGIELSGGNAIFLYVVGALLLLARIAHAVGLKYDNIAHPGRLIGAGGTALITFVCVGYALWLVAT